MQRYLWMRPAFQKSEAVLLPALPQRQRVSFLEELAQVKASEDPFRPIPQEGEKNLALSTYVRPRGSMCGRSVLRAAGMSAEPFASRSKPRYYLAQGRATARGRTMPQASRWPVH